MCSDDRRAIFVCLTGDGATRHRDALPTHREVLTRTWGAAASLPVLPTAAAVVEALAACAPTPTGPPCANGSPPARRRSGADGVAVRCGKGEHRPAIAEVERARPPGVRAEDGGVLHPRLQGATQARGRRGASASCTTSTCVATTGSRPGTWWTARPRGWSAATSPVATQQPRCSELASRPPLRRRTAITAPLSSTRPAAHPRPRRSARRSRSTLAHRPEPDRAKSPSASSSSTPAPATRRRCWPS